MHQKFKMNLLNLIKEIQSVLFFVTEFTKSFQSGTQSCFSSFKKLQLLKLLSANPTKWSNTLKQFVG